VADRPESAAAQIARMPLHEFPSLILSLACDGDLQRQADVSVRDHAQWKEHVVESLSLIRGHLRENDSVGYRSRPTWPTSPHDLGPPLDVAPIGLDPDGEHGIGLRRSSNSTHIPLSLRLRVQPTPARSESAASALYTTGSRKQIPVIPEWATQPECAVAFASPALHSCPRLHALEGTYDIPCPFASKRFGSERGNDGRAPSGGPNNAPTPKTAMNDPRQAAGYRLLF